MIQHRYVAALAAALVVGVAGCAAPDEPGLKPAQEETVSDAPPTPSPSDSPTPGDPVALAVADLAEHLGVDAAEVEVDSREEVTWRDGSLGCARKGELYTQALVDGGRITLRAGGSTYEYHYGGRRAPFRCDNPTQ